MNSVSEGVRRQTAGEDDAYSWEAAYAEGLDIGQVLKEDESGLLQPVEADSLWRAKRGRRLTDRPANVRLGIMRHVYVVLDCSETMTEKDLIPSRIACSATLLKTFFDKFYEQNPISRIGLITTRNRRAETVVELTGSMRKHEEALENISETLCSGEPSLQNSVELALRGLKSVPSHTSREIIVIMGSLSTCDPGNISATIELLKREKIKCSIIGLSAEVFVFHRLCKETGGIYRVILNETNFEHILMSSTTPPVATKDQESNLVKMGFPIHRKTGSHEPSICVCHADDVQVRQPTADGYFCPQCNAKYCSLPIECRICRLTSVSAPQLARSYQHLDPLPVFQEIDAPSNSECKGCGKMLHLTAYKCNTCAELFCIDCDLLLHESLQVCPGCF